MTAEWIRFALTALLLGAALVSFTLAVWGVYHFGFVLNRVHASGIGDTQGILCIVAGIAIAAGPGLGTCKLLLLLVFLWLTSPTSTHFLGQVEYFTNPHLYRHVKREPEKETQHGTD